MHSRFKRTVLNIIQQVKKMPVNYIVVLFIFVVTYYTAQSIIIEGSLKRLEEHVIGAACEMDKLMMSHQKTIDILGTDLVLQNDLSTVKSFLKIHYDLDPAFYDLYLGLSNDTGIFANWSNPGDWKATDREWYKAAMSANGKITAIAYEGFISGRTFAAFSKYIGKIGGLDAVLSGDVELSKLTQGMETISKGLYPGSYSFLTDENGQILAHTNHQFISAKNDLHDKTDFPVYDEVYSRFQASEKAILLEDYDHVKRYFLPQKLECGWILYIVVPQKAMVAGFNAKIVWLIFVLFALLLYNVYERNKAVVVSDTKNKFIAHISHEMRTPMNAILGLSELLTRRKLAPDVLEQVKQIQTASRNLLEIINDLLDLSQIESGKLKISEGEYFLESLLDDVSTIISLKAQEKNLEFVIEVDENTPARLIGDEVRIRQILTNLLANAVKYTNEGSVLLSIHSVLYDHGSEAMVTIEVTDSGIGIKEEDMPALFGTFVRFDQHKNKDVEGTGLGLSIVQKLCNLMGGSVKATSVYGEGSKFTVEIPQKLALYEKYVSHEKNDSGAQVFSFSAPDVHILIADDISLNLKIAAELMEPYKMKIDTCRNGLEAVEMVMAKEYDIVFLDHMMPVMNGLQAAKKIRVQGGAKFDGLPIIALTANVVMDARSVLAANGMNDFLAKPIDCAKLDKLLSKWIPDDKKEAPCEITTFAQNEGEEPNKFVNALRQMPMFSVSRALETIGGSEKSYAKIVKLALDMLPETIEKLNGLVEADAAQYRIEVHGIKGVLNTIGVYEVARLAEKIENMVGEEALAEIVPVHTDLNHQLAMLIQSTASILAEESRVDKPEGILKHLHESLPEIKEFLDSFDRDGALECLTLLMENSYEQEIDKVLLEIVHLLERFQYKKAVEKIGELESFCKKNYEVFIRR